METIDILIKLIQDNTIVTVVTSVVTVFSVIAASTPTPKEGTFLSKLYKLVDILAVNVGKAKDK
jgi:hypothetical protein